jgi:hypothetical protein
LLQQDILPFWIEPLLETTYAVMRLADIVRAYNAGTIDRDEVKRQLIRRGYSDDDAENVTRFYEQEKQSKLRNHKILQRFARLEVTQARVVETLSKAGALPETIEQALEQTYPKMRSAPPITDYIRGYITLPQLTDRLSAVGIPPNVVQSLIDYARQRRLAPVRKRCLEAIRKRFLTGLTDELQARNELVALLQDVEEANDYLATLKCEAVAIARPIAASTLCTWFEQGLVTPDQAYQALRRQGYTDEDAWRALASCAIRLGERQARDLERLQERLQREAEKQQREAERRREKAEREAAKRAQKLEALRRQQQRREERLHNLKALIQEKTGLDMVPIHQWVTETYRILREQANMHPDEAISIMLMAAQRYPWSDLAQLSAVVADLWAESKSFDEILQSQHNGQGG